MARQRHTPKGRLLITGTVLLILLVAGILTAGRTINGVAVQMSGRIVRHISEYHYRLLQVEFERSEGVLDASVQFMRERTAPTDGDPDRRTFHDYGCSDNRVAGRIAYDTGNHSRLLRLGFRASVLQYNVRALDRIGYICSPEHGVKRLLQRTIHDLYRNNTFHIHVLGASEKIFRLTLNLIHNLLHTNLFHTNSHTNVLRVNVGYGICDGQNE